MYRHGDAAENREIDRKSQSIYIQNARAKTVERETLICLSFPRRFAEIKERAAEAKQKAIEGVMRFALMGCRRRCCWLLCRTAQQTEEKESNKNEGNP